MIESNLKKVVQTFTDIVESIEILEIEEREGISKLKAKLRIFDGSILWVREVWIKEIMEVYSYYWLRPDETMIIEWDNAPHHGSVRTFPHHKHIGDRIDESQERKIEEVLNFIKHFFLNSSKLYLNFTNLTVQFCALIQRVSYLPANIFL